MADEVIKTEEKMEQVKEEVKDTPQEEQTEDAVSYSQEQVEDLISRRISKEREKLYKQLGTNDLKIAKSALEEKKELEKQKQIQKGDFEKILKQQAEESTSKINDLSRQLQQLKINDALIGSASKHKAVNVDQVVKLLKSDISLNDDGVVEVLANNGTPRYNGTGELLTVDEYVNEFLTLNPHFVNATPAGSGSVGNTARPSPSKPLNLGDLDMTKQSDKELYREYRKERDSKPTVINLTK